MPVVERRLVVTEESGLHARPAAAFVQAATRTDAQVTVARADAGPEVKPVNARSVLSLLALSVRCGEEIVLRADGADEETARQAVDALAAIAAPA
ncbi:HPr family phosphocarrier protein [Streptomyces sp. NPDC056333]|uniref:HPr family phosphocarrier protein n=1 Tax=Streptomyces sp. NPDC056333 TaxID=3345786 RepID=UPI0035E26E2A